MGVDDESASRNDYPAKSTVLISALLAVWILGATLWLTILYIQGRPEAMLTTANMLLYSFPIFMIFLMVDFTVNLYGGDWDVR